MRLDEIELRNEFNALNDDKKCTYEMLAEANLARAPFLHDKIMELLHKTNSTISYNEIASQMRDIVSIEAVRRHVIRLEGFKVRKTIILPYLDENIKRRRVK